MAIFIYALNKNESFYINWRICRVRTIKFLIRLLQFSLSAGKLIHYRQRPISIWKSIIKVHLNNPISWSPWRQSYSCIRSQRLYFIKQSFLGISSHWLVKVCLLIRILSVPTGVEIMNGAPIQITKSSSPYLPLAMKLI